MEKQILIRFIRESLSHETTDWEILAEQDDAGSLWDDLAKIATSDGKRELLAKALEMLIPPANAPDICGKIYKYEPEKLIAICLMGLIILETAAVPAVLRGIGGITANRAAIFRAVKLLGHAALAVSITKKLVAAIDVWCADIPVEEKKQRVERIAFEMILEISIVLAARYFTTSFGPPEQFNAIGEAKGIVASLIRCLENIFGALPSWLKIVIGEVPYGLSSSIAMMNEEKLSKMYMLWRYENKEYTFYDELIRMQHARSVTKDQRDRLRKQLGNPDELTFEDLEFSLYTGISVSEIPTYLDCADRELQRIAAKEAAEEKLKADPSKYQQVLSDKNLSPDVQKALKAWQEDALGGKLYSTPTQGPEIRNAPVDAPWWKN